MENSLSGFIHLMSLNSLQNIYWIDDVESTNSMSQEIGPVTLCHSMSLVVTLTKDCAPPLIFVTLLVKVSQGHNYQIAMNKTCMVHKVLFLQIAHMSRQTTANKLSTGHRVLFFRFIPSCHSSACECLPCKQVQCLVDFGALLHLWRRGLFQTDRFQ